MAFIVNLLGLVARTAYNYSYDQDWENFNGHTKVQKLTDEDGVDYIKRQRAVLLFFYSKNCSYCDAMKPEIAKAASELSGKGSFVKVAAVEGVVHGTVPKYFGVKAVPTLNLYQEGKFVVEYIWRRKAADIVDFVEKSQS